MSMSTIYTVVETDKWGNVTPWTRAYTDLAEAQDAIEKYLVADFKASSDGLRMPHYTPSVAWGWMDDYYGHANLYNTLHEVDVYITKAEAL